MSDLTTIFGDGAKVVVSPDKMRAWVSLPKPAKGVRYTAEAITQWLPKNGVVFGADAELIRKAAASDRWDDLLEVARGLQPVAAEGGDYKLLIEKKPFTGLAAVGDGSLVYDDLSFLQEVAAGQPLAEVVPPVEAQNGSTVTGEVVPPREGTPGRQLSGSGYVVSEDGRTYLAPVTSHVNVVNEQLVVTPVKKLAGVSAEDGEVSFDGNILVEGDVTAGGRINATGSVFVTGRAAAPNITAGNNVLLCTGVRGEGGFGSIQAKGNVWGQFFESCQITAGGDVCANHLTGCEVTAEGRANILGGRGTVARTRLYAKNGVVANVLGDAAGGETIIQAGVDQAFLDNYTGLEKKTERLAQDIQVLQQNITTHERLNRMKADKGKGDAAYKEMVQKRDQSISVQKILDGERTRLRRTLDSFSTVSIVARGEALAGVVIIIDSRSMTVPQTMARTRFHRDKDVIQAVAAQR